MFARLVEEFEKSVTDDCTPNALGATLAVVMVIVFPTSVPTWKVAVKFSLRKVCPLYSVWLATLPNSAMSYETSLFMDPLS